MERQGTLEVLELVKSWFDDEAVIMKEVVGWKVGCKERYRGLFILVSHMEKGDGTVRSGLVIITLSRVVLMGVF